MSLSNAQTTWRGTSMPPGSVIAFAGEGTPAGWLECNGGAVSRAKYSRLFKVIDTRYGNGGGQPGSFSLPNYQGRFLRGVSGDSKNDPDADVRTAAWTGGKTGNVVGSEQLDAIQRHRHSYPFGHAGSPDGDTPHRKKTDPGPIAIQSSDPELANVSSETRPRNVYVRWLIRY
jgi:microcystin-dependent protein